MSYCVFYLFALFGVLYTVALTGLAGGRCETRPITLLRYIMPILWLYSGAFYY